MLRARASFGAPLGTRPRRAWCGSSSSSTGVINIFIALVITIDIIIVIICSTIVIFAFIIVIIFSTIIIVIIFSTHRYQSFGGARMHPARLQGAGSVQSHIFVLRGLLER